MRTKNVRICLVVRKSLSNGKPYTDLHINATNCLQYLEYTSPHPDYTIKSTVHSQTLRFIRLCLFKENFL